jgi:hypothetical protein
LLAYLNCQRQLRWKTLISWGTGSEFPTMVSHLEQERKGRKYPFVSRNTDFNISHHFNFATEFLLKLTLLKLAVAKCFTVSM